MKTLRAYEWLKTNAFSCKVPRRENWTILRAIIIWYVIAISLKFLQGNTWMSWKYFRNNISRLPLHLFSLLALSQLRVVSKWVIKISRTVPVAVKLVRKLNVAGSIPLTDPLRFFFISKVFFSPFFHLFSPFFLPNAMTHNNVAPWRMVRFPIMGL